MSYEVMSENTIFKCTNPVCQGTFTILSYIFADKGCTIIDSVKPIPLTGNTPFFCPCCGKNLAEKEKGE